MSIEIRHITDNERNQELELRKYGFGDAPNDEVEEADLKRMDPAEIIGAFEGGRLLAAAQAYRFSQMVRGVPKTCGGIAGVAAFPEARRRGLVRKVMNATLAELAEDGVAVSMLHPFKVSFYRSFGYITTDDTVVATYPPSAFASYLSHDGAKAAAVERYGPSDFNQAWAAFCELDTQSNGKAHGPILFSSIAPAQPSRRLDDRFVVLFQTPATGSADAGAAGNKRLDRATGRPPSESAGRVVAGMVYRKEGGEPDGRLLVDYYRALPGFLPAVLRFVALHIDQCATARMPVAPMSTTNRLYARTGDIDGHVTPEPSRRPWMVRIVDVAAALDGIPVLSEGEVTVAVTDEGGRWNTGVYTLRAGKKLTLTVERADPGAAAAADISLDQETLCRLLYGAADPMEILATTSPGAPPTSERAAGAVAVKTGAVAARSGSHGPPTSTSRVEAVETLSTWFPERVFWNDWMF